MLAETSEQQGWPRVSGWSDERHVSVTVRNHALRKRSIGTHGEVSPSCRALRSDGLGQLFEQARFGANRQTGRRKADREETMSVMLQEGSPREPRAHETGNGRGAQRTHEWSKTSRSGR